MVVLIQQYLLPPFLSSKRSKVTRACTTSSSSMDARNDQPGFKDFPHLSVPHRNLMFPNVFCAGADLKERKTMNPSEVRLFVNSLRSTFSFLENSHFRFQLLLSLKEQHLVVGWKWLSRVILEYVDITYLSWQTEYSLCGMVEFYSVLTGVYDYLRTHALISVQTHQGLIENCVKSIVLPMCTEFQERSNFEMGGMDLFNVVYEPCTTKNSSRSSPDSDITDPCQKQYVGVYLNLPHVQRALHANVTKLAYPWGPCSWASKTWTDSPSMLLPLYKKLILTGLRILLYSGDLDGVIPVTSAEYSIRALNLTVENPWRPWRDGATEQVAGFRVDYQGLTFATVRGAGHEAPRDQPLRVMALAKLFLEDE